MQMLFWRLGGLHCHANVLVFPCGRGKCNFFFVFGSASFVFFLRFFSLGVAVLNKSSGANFCFSVLGVFFAFFSLGVVVLNKLAGANFCFRCWVFVLCFRWFFAQVFALWFGVSLPKLLKYSLSHQLCFFGIVLTSLGFFRRHRLFFSIFSRDKDQVVTKTPPHRTFLVRFFSLFCSAAFGLSPALTVHPFSRRFSRGAILGPVSFVDSPGTCGVCFGTRGGKGVLAFLPCGVVFCHAFLDAQVGGLTKVG